MLDGVTAIPHLREQVRNMSVTANNAKMIARPLPPPAGSCLCDTEIVFLADVGGRVSNRVCSVRSQTGWLVRWSWMGAGDLALQI